MVFGRWKLALAISEQEALPASTGSMIKADECIAPGAPHRVCKVNVCAFGALVRRAYL
jgi:hypothetical protein